MQEPNFTNNKVVTVRLGDSVGPYRVTKILTHQVELVGPGGTISVPLAGLPGAVSVASSTGPSSAGTVQSQAGELPPHRGLKNPNEIVIPRGDPRRNFPASAVLVGAGAVVGGVASQAPQPQSTQLRTASPVRDVSVPAAMQTPQPELPPHRGLKNPNEIVIPRGDPRRNFPASAVLVGAGAVVGGLASQAPQPQSTQLRTASPVRDVSVPAAMQTPPPELAPHRGLKNPNEIVIPRGDPRRNFPASKMLIGG